MLDIALTSVMCEGLLRVSVASALRWQDIEEEEDGTGRLLIRRSKTDAEGEGAVAFLSVQTMESLDNEALRPKSNLYIAGDLQVCHLGNPTRGRVCPSASAGPGNRCR